MKNKLAFVIIPILCMLYTPSDAQSTNLRELFFAAESYFLFEEFDEALPLYLRIYRQSPDNDNISFKIGVCYLNLPYEKDKSVRYLEKAVQNINPKYKENNFRETSAPPEALFFLGNAYRVNNMLNKAREAYFRFLDILDQKVYDEEMVREQIRATEAAEILMENPADVGIDILPSIINSRFSDINPVVSGNERHMIYVSRLQFYDAVLYTEKINGEWSAPRNIIPELGVDGDVFPTSLSWDGTELFVYRSDNFIGNIYYSKRVGEKWTSLVKLNENINTKYWESHASLSQDGKTLYFTSNRINGYGGLDIYMSHRMPNGSWGPAVNLGPTINSKYNEETPFITEDDKKLFFSSYGHYNMGGYDVFVSEKKENGSWSEPGNLGYPVNTTDDDMFFHPVKNGDIAYYSRIKKDGNGRHDIYRYTIYGPDNPRLYTKTEVPVSTPHSGLTISEKTVLTPVRPAVSPLVPSELITILDTVTDKDGNTITKKAKVISKQKERADQDEIQSLIEEPVSIQFKSSETDSLIDLYQQLLLNASAGNLKLFIKNLDPHEEGIKTREEFISFLKRNTGINGFAEEDINRMLENSPRAIIISPEEQITETYDSEDTKTKRKIMPEILVFSGIVFIFTGLIILFLLWKKRRKKKEE